MKSVILSMLLIASTACTSYKRPYTMPSAADVLKSVTARNIEGLRARGKVDTITARG